MTENLSNKLERDDTPDRAGGAAPEVQDQAILPLSIAFGLCIRGIRTKLGRSFVTLMGVCFGIAFLMSLISSVHLKDRLAVQAAAKREVDRTIALTRGEVGALKGKRVIVVGARPAQGKQDDLHRALRIEQGADVIDMRGIDDRMLDAAVSNEKLPSNESGVASQSTLPVIVVGEPNAILTALSASALDGKTVLVFSPLSDEARRWAQTRGVALESDDEAGHGRIKVLSLALRDEEVVREKTRADRERWRTIWVLGASLLLTVIGIANAMLMSVTERFREIGTMKCLGALPNFVVRLFLIESTLLGIAGSALGCIIGAGFAFIAYGYTFGYGIVVASMSVPTLILFACVSVAVGVSLSIVAAIYPAQIAARMVPASALASTI